MSTRFQSTLLKNYVFSFFAKRKEWELWWIDFFFFSLLLFRFLTGRWLPSQWALWSVNETGCIQYWETHLYGCNTSKFIVIFVLSLWFSWLVCLPSKVNTVFAGLLTLQMQLKILLVVVLYIFNIGLSQNWKTYERSYISHNAAWQHLSLSCVST